MTLRSITYYYITLHQLTYYYTTLHYIALHYITLYTCMTLDSITKHDINMIEHDTAFYKMT